VRGRAAGGVQWPTAAVLNAGDGGRGVLGVPLLINNLEALIQPRRRDRLSTRFELASGSRQGCIPFREGTVVLGLENEEDLRCQSEDSDESRPLSDCVGSTISRSAARVAIFRLLMPSACPSCSRDRPDRQDRGSSRTWTGSSATPDYGCGPRDMTDGDPPAVISRTGRNGLQDGSDTGGHNGAICIR